MGRVFSDEDFADAPVATAPTKRTFADDDFQDPTPLGAAAESIKEKPAMSRGGAAALGAIGGLTSDFDDEAIGTVGAAHAALNAPARWAAKGLRALGVQSEGIAKLADEPGVVDAYKGNRDALRGLHDEAKGAHPGYHMGGEVAGGIAQSLLPGVGALGKGATIGGTALRAAGLGAVGGLGASEATDAGGLARDAAIGGATAGALGGAAWTMGRLSAGAAGRVAKRELGTLVSGATDKAKKAVFGFGREEIPHALDVMKNNPELARAGGNAVKRLGAAEAAVERASQKTAPVYSALEGTGAAVPDSRVIANMEDVVKEFSANSADRKLAKAARGMVEDFKKTAAEQGRNGSISFSQLREEATRRLANGFKDGKIGEADAAKLARKMGFAMTDALHDEAEAVARAHPGLKIDVAKLKADNKEFSTLLKIKKATEKAAENAAVPRENNFQSLKEIGTKLAVGAVTAVPRKADKALASYVKLVKAGGKPGELIRRGVELGIPAETARRVVAGFGPSRQTDETTEE